MKHLISLKEQTKEDILEILEMTKRLKERREQGELISCLAGKTLIMLFQKTSTRTRLSFEAAMTELGGHAIYLDARATQLSIVDFKDEIRAIMRFGQVLMFRARKAADVEYAASLNQIPVIDGCSEKYHPAQSLGDIFTMMEKAGGLDKIKKVVWLGIENNVSNTLMLACTKLGIKFCLAAPVVDKESVDEELNKQAIATGLVTRTSDSAEALNGADFVHTDTWLNMEFFDKGAVRPEFQKIYTERKRMLAPHQLSAGLIEKYAPQAKIMHCMPCHVGYEISQDAINHPNSVIFDQAENRLHVQKAILLWLLKKEILIK